MFVDDTALFLSDWKDGLDRVMSVLQKFGVASRTKPE
jgi:hypothetical protein